MHVNQLHLKVYLPPDNLIGPQEVPVNFVSLFMEFLYKLEATRMPKDKYDKDNHQHHNGIGNHSKHNGVSRDNHRSDRGHRIMSQDEVIGGKKSHWDGLELTGGSSPGTWQLKKHTANCRESHMS